MCERELYGTLRVCVCASASVNMSVSYRLLEWLKKTMCKLR